MPKQLVDMIAGLPVRHVSGPRDALIHAVLDDSRQASSGAIFLARSGTKSDGRRFVDDAVKRGAAVVLADQPVEAPPHVTVLQSDSPAESALRMAMTLHDHPHRRLRLVGVTGTKGKTTIAFMVRHLMRAAGERCGMIGTVEIDDGAACRPAELTTPGALELIALLGRMVAHGCSHCVMEVSSHALHQRRVAMLDFAAAAFTNLTGDHLDYHKTMEDYASAKATLFAMLGGRAAAVVNAESNWAPRMLKDCRALPIGFAMADAPTHAQPSIVGRVDRADAEGSVGSVEGPWGRMPLKLPMIGRHNVLNLLAALGLMHGLGMEPTSLAGAVERMPGAPGRLQPVRLEDRPLPFAVLVDYAHTDDALANVLTAMRPLTAGRLRVMFGCGGDRDPTKRPRMAAVACRLADHVVITSDNPRTEDPERIIGDILAGVSTTDRPRVMVEPDRAAAIRRILASAERGDVVLLAGKGHEDYQVIGTTKRPFDDRLHALRVLEEIAAAPAR